MEGGGRGEGGFRGGGAREGGLGEGEAWGGDVGSCVGVARGHWCGNLQHKAEGENGLQSRGSISPAEAVT